MVFNNFNCNSINISKSGSVFIKLIGIIIGKKEAKNPEKRENIFKNIFENGDY